MDNNRVGMAINYDYPDYGGILQAYTSFRKIRDLGYQPEAINNNKNNKVRKSDKCQ